MSSRGRFTFFEATSPGEARFAGAGRIRHVPGLLLGLSLLLTGCFQEAQPAPNPFVLQVRMHSTIQGGPVAEGVWSRDVALVVSEADASALGVDERTQLEVDGVGALFASLDTVLIGDDESDLGFCLEDSLVVSDQTKRLEYLLAEAGTCFAGPSTLRVQVEFEEEWTR